MRLTCSVIIALALAGLTPAFAADSSSVREARYHYTACNCHFGYGSACQIAISCATEGGRCSGSCTLPRQTD
jgi:hypothetical protein